jgi:hypothetical protein
MSPNGLDKFYLAELQANATYDIQLRVGYFGEEMNSPYE